MAEFESGTRSWSNLQQGVRATGRNFTRSYTRDVGMSKQATGAFSFNAGTGQVTLAGAFGAFVFNDEIVFEGTASNNSSFIITATGANTLQLNPPPVTEVAPATAYARAG